MTNHSCLNHSLIQTHSKIAKYTALVNKSFSALSSCSSIHVSDSSHPPALSQLLQLWEKNGYFDDETIQQLQNPALGLGQYQVSELRLKAPLSCWCQASGRANTDSMHFMHLVEFSISFASADTRLGHYLAPNKVIVLILTSASKYSF